VNNQQSASASQRDNSNVNDVVIVEAPPTNPPTINNANEEQLPLCFDSTYTENNQQDTNALQVDNSDVNESLQLRFLAKTRQ
jgi:hypothetical protein